jgi:hypothetical protein
MNGGTSAPGHGFASNPPTTPAPTTSSTSPVGAGLTGFEGIWPAETDTQLRQLQADAAAGKADWALRPDATAERFAAEVAHWDPSKISVHSVQPGRTAEVELWNTGMGSYSPQISLNVQLRKAGDVWIVRHTEDGLFDLQCPSIRQDVLPLGVPQQLCGQFSQTPAGWTVTAVLMDAGEDLGGGEREQTATPTISGDRFTGSLTPETYFRGTDVDLVVTVTSGSGQTLGLWARRFSTGG